MRKTGRHGHFKHSRPRVTRSRRGTLQAVALAGVAVASAGVLAGAAIALSRSSAVAETGTRLSAASAERGGGAGTMATPGGDATFVRLAPPKASGRDDRAAGEARSVAARPVARGQDGLALTAADKRACPAAAQACVDLAGRLTWLQSGGRLTFGPVRMEPGSGPQGTAHATPRGVFHVEWKAGPGFVSNIYGEPMPWATFFAPGGVAFHGGSLTQASHGCVHLAVGNAKYYHDNLPVGSEVAVF